MTLVLASASAARRKMLEQAGIPALIEAAAIDEGMLKSAAAASGRGAAAVAEALAREKALSVATRHPGALVIGADQMLACGERWFDKPVSVAEARAQLQDLRGRTHILTSSVVAVRDGAVLWCHSDQARLSMRTFSDGFLDGYLAALGETVCSTVGAYRIEGLGLQLFEAVEGDHFVILGMPLLPLLGFLRDQGVLTS